MNKRIEGIPDLRDLYEVQGKSAQEIGKILGVRYYVILRRLREQGIRLRNRRLPEMDKKKIKKMYLSGVPLNEIAEKFFCSLPAIKQRIYKMELPPRKLPNLTYKSYRQAHIMRSYGITMAEFNNILKKQRGRCRICQKKPSGSSPQTRRLHIDHCHKTKKFRGLICCNCNRGLGWFEDDSNLLRKAALYLERFQ
jgi:hypothetical protein